MRDGHNVYSIRSVNTPDPAESTPAPVTAADMSSDLALQVLARVRLESASRDLRLAAVIVDRGGNTVASSRMDGAQLGALSLAGDKAYTAVAFGHPTGRWAGSSAPGGGDWGLSGTLGGRAIVFAGGVPLYLDGQLIGGLGVSGAASSQDEECAVAAATALGLRTTP